jgi:preprotein translocase subunit YajC
MFSYLYGMAPPSGTQGGGAGGLTAILPLILIFVVFYFLLIMPQQRKQKQHREMIEGIKRGDKVVTSGGIHGTVAKVNKDALVIKVSEKAELTMDKSAIAAVLH